MDPGHEPDDDGDAARAFEALREEVAALRRGVELVIRQGQEAPGPIVAGPDYSPTLGKMAQALQAIAARLEAVERQPALRLTPASFRGEIDDVALSVVGTVSRPFAEAVQDVRNASRDLTALAGQIREQGEQRAWVFTAGVLGLMLGVGLWYVAAGVLPGGVGNRIAASLIGGDRWHAGATLMEEASPESWDKMVRLYKACPQDTATELCEAAMAVGTIAPARQEGKTPPAPAPPPRPPPRGGHAGPQGQ